LDALYRIGIDENGLGARLGPLVVTAVIARTDENGRRALERRMPKRMRGVVNDSKRLVSHTDVRLGEAWARELAASSAPSPEALFEELSLEGTRKLREPCPRAAEAQCWHTVGGAFEAGDALRKRVARHRALLAKRGIELVGVKTSVVCTERLNAARREGKNRFVSDLHAMERLTLAFRKQVDTDVVAICGKVGGMSDYSRFFGPLSGYLHAVMEQKRACSAYRFPGVGELHFVKDADAADPLVMLASLVGKYMRELLMQRISQYYEGDDTGPSGYHDPVTRAFVERTQLVRKRRRIPSTCFERIGAQPPAAARSTAGDAP
jgi:ribonuclease HII